VEQEAPLKPVADLALPCLVHDLNNVFQTLVEAADLLSDDPQWMDVSAAILRSIERGKEIGASLMTVNQPSAPLETVLGNAVDFVLDSVQLGHGPDIRFIREIDPGMELRHSWAWERVFMNLFINAVRAMPGGGTIAVRAHRVDSRIEIRVADEGSGIPAELLPFIFDPHVSNRANSGLGLHIVRTIVREHDGEVRAANREERGAEFLITIPAEAKMVQSARA
jgi:signal transduction histidine kinase